MLSLFKIKNFKSILEEEISLKYGEGKAPNGYRESEEIAFLETKNSRLVPCLMFLGPNASGKSNLLEAFLWFKRIIKKGIKGAFKPNKLNNKFNTTVFEIEFFILNNKYNYIVEYNNSEILKEILNENDSILYAINKIHNTNFTTIETKGYSKTNFQNLLEVECSIMTEDKNYQQQYTFLSKISEKYPGLNKSLLDVFNYFSSNLEVYGENKFHVSFAIDKLSGEESSESIQNSFKRIDDLIKKLDISIDSSKLNRSIESKKNDEELSIDSNVAVSFKKTSTEQVLIKTDLIETYHRDIRGELIKFNFNEESFGTQVLFGLLGVILSALDEGKVLVVDELDRSLHPVLFRELIKLFKSKRYNQNNAQLIFSTHTTDILEDSIIRISEVGIVDKTLKNGTTLKRLSDFKDIRNVNNFRKQYLSGMFLGIPNSYV